MAAATIRLRHVAWTTDGTLNFYDGSVRVHGGVVELPLGQRHWHVKAWLDGYRLDPDTGIEIPSISEYADRLAEILAAMVGTKSLEPSEATTGDA